MIYNGCKYMLIVCLVLLYVYYGHIKTYRSEKIYDIDKLHMIDGNTVDLFDSEGYMNVKGYGKGKSITKNINTGLHKIASLFGTPDISMGRMKKMDTSKIFSQKDIAQYMVLDTGYSIVMIVLVYNFDDRTERYYTQEVSKILRGVSNNLKIDWMNNIGFDDTYINDISIDKHVNYTSRGRKSDNESLSIDIGISIIDDDHKKYDVRINMTSIDHHVEALPLDGRRGEYSWYYTEKYHSYIDSMTMKYMGESIIQKGSRFAVSDYKRGILPYFNHKTTAYGYTVDSDGDHMMFTFSSGFNSDHSDVYIHNDYAVIKGHTVIYKPVVISYDPLNFMNSWSVHTHDDHINDDGQYQIDLTFASAKYSPKSKELFKLYRWKVEHVYGYWSGYIRDSKGRMIFIDNAVGINESMEFVF